MKKFVTAALPYANGPIHIGHLVEYIQADICVRFLKLVGEDVLFICADDAHGAPIEINAAKQGVKPEELIAKYYKEHVEDFSAFHIKFDNYYTTNSEENKEYSDLIFNTLKSKGLIYDKEVELTYCPVDKRFLPDRYVRGTCPKCGASDQYGDVCEKCNSAYKTTDLINPYCALCKTTPIRKNSKHYFFKVSAFSAKLKDFITSHKQIQDEVKNFILEWIKQGLEDWDISRDGPYFGFLIPGEVDKYYYVWLDAPIGYFASLANYCKKNDLDPMEFLKGEGSFGHFIGKDIMYFHLLFWPAMLMGSGFNLPVFYNVHGFLTVNGEKMSKSRGTFLTAKEFLEISEPEFLRFYFASNLGTSIQDIDLNWQDYFEKVNNELVSKIANFSYRVQSFCEQHFDGNLIQYADENVEKNISSEIKETENAYRNRNLKKAVQHILEIASIGNRYFQEKEPWKLIKQDKKKAQKIVSYSIAIARKLAVLIQPITPQYSEKLAKQLNSNLKWSSMPFEKMSINKSEIILRKLDDVPEIKTDPFSTLQIKIGKILSIEDHPNAEKLYVIKVDTGEERQIVAGLKPFIAKAELLGKHVCVLTNLKPAILRGKESQGMMLAADDGTKVSPLEAPHSKPGEKVSAEGILPEQEPREITFDDFKKIQLVVKNNHATYNGKILQTQTEKVRADIGDGAKIR
ncbi:MAG: methionine--tRNA ligase [Nanoarchaeota archaeon]|nr:MAG: methionine--tRNA ligase [Nanoarchaeota archaeon]